MTDSISDWLFVTEPAGQENLLREGKRADCIFFVGHVMVDNLFYQVDLLRDADLARLESSAIKARRPRYGVVTLHRPSNVDDEPVLRGIVAALSTVAAELPLVFPVHPRTRANIERHGIRVPAGIELTAPLSYMDFLNLWKDAALVMTDSGGLQEETTALGVPCLTLRANTERPITCEMGTSTLLGSSASRLRENLESVRSGRYKIGVVPKLWDGEAATRIAAHLVAI